MLKIKIAGHLTLLGYLSATPLKPVKIERYLQFLYIPHFYIEFAVMLM